MAINSAIIRSLYNLPPSDILSYALAVLVTGIGMSWLSHQVADLMLAKRMGQVEQEEERSAMKPELSFGILGAFLVFIFVFVATAAPPV